MKLDETAYVEVVVALATDTVDRPFHYRIPDRLRGRIVPGQKVIVPFGHRTVEAYITAMVSRPQSNNLKEIARLVDPLPVYNREQLELARWMSEHFFCRRIDALRAIFSPLIQKIKGRQTTVVHLAPGALDKLPELRRRAPKQAAVVEVLAAGKKMPAAQLCRLAACTTAPLKRLEEKGLITLSREMAPDPVWAGQEPVFPALTDEQSTACRLLAGGLDRGYASFLLFGITGSGKTEVYLQAVKEALARGRGSVVLVPEIALTPQMIRIFASRFGHTLAVLHSRLTPGERYQQWQRIREGRAMVVLGARSAVFAPVHAPGLFILDEEHESSYKQDEAPRYHTRDVARFRARYNDAVLLLGSATPSLESFVAAGQGRCRLLRLTGRINAAPLPPVEIVDMRREHQSGNRSIISRRLYQALKEVVERGEQAILFLNRRGFAGFILCRDCGHVIRCPHCNVSLTYHSSLKALVCHYCFHRQALPAVCPRCRGTQIMPLGAGTQKLEQEVRRRFPGVAVVRLDADTVRQRTSYKELLDSFRSGRSQILVGTQMVAKGLDFPRVTLTGIVSADVALNLPDFRAAEKTFQLLTQVAGRAGRGPAGGRVIVQTYHAGHYSIDAFKNYDYDTFYKQELQLRQELGYPPFKEMIIFVVQAPAEEDARRFSLQLEKALRDGLSATAHELLGPAPAPIARLNRYYRWQLFLKGENLHRACHVIRDACSRLREQGKSSGLRLVIDFDPQKVL